MKNIVCVLLLASFFSLKSMEDFFSKTTEFLYTNMFNEMIQADQQFLPKSFDTLMHSDYDPSQIDALIKEFQEVKSSGKIKEEVDKTITSLEKLQKEFATYASDTEKKSLLSDLEKNKAL